MKIGTIHTGAVFRHKVGYIRNGKKVWVTDWRNNLILDTGLNALANNVWPAMFNYCLFGDQVSPDPVQRNSGSVTFITTGTACAASGNFFVAQDVGRLIKFDDGSGQERYITNYTDAQNVTLGVAPSPAIASDTATIWYVNQTALQSFVQATATYDQTGGSNGSAIAGNVITHKRTFVGTALLAPTTLTEIGFNTGGGNTNIFDRDIIPGGIALLTGDIPLAIGELICTWNHTTPLAVGNVATGFDSSGDTQLTGLYIFATSLATIDSSGGIASPTSPGGYGPLDPAFLDWLYLASVDFSIPAFNNTYSGNVTNLSADSRTGGYNGSGTFSKDTTCHWGLTSGNGTIYGFANRSQGDLWMCHLTTPFVKLSTQTLDITTRKSWQRLLTN